jgi:outer membrane receptor protein involved in Fe transport
VHAQGENFPGAVEPTVSSGALQRASEDREKVWNAGFFLQNVFDISNKYFLTGGVRVDGNSAFGEGFGLQVYPKVSGTWVISDEDFWNEGWGAIKLRAAYGQSGRAPGAFDAVRTWEPIGWGTAEAAFKPQNLGNDDLGPEQSQEFEVGFDGSFLNQRLTADVTYTPAPPPTRSSASPRPARREAGGRSWRTSARSTTPGSRRR